MAHACPNCGVLTWTGGECAMVHGDGPASGQAGLDRTGQAGQASECAGGQGCVEEQELASKLKSKPWEDRSLHVPPSNHPTPFGNGCGGSRLRDGDCSTTRVGSEWALGSRNEGYSRRGGFSAASGFSGPLLRNTSIVPASSSTRIGRPYDDPVGSRQSTFSSCSHLMRAFELPIQATACWDIIAPTQYCSSAGHVPTCLRPRGRAWFPGAGTESVGPTVGSHKTPTRPPSQVLALPFIPLLSSQQRRQNPQKGT